MGHAKVLSKIEDEDTIKKFAKQIKDNHISVRDLEALASNPSIPKNNPVKRKVTNQYNYVEEAMTEAIGNKVKISNKKIVIPFNSDKDLERILEILNIEVKVD